jgi:hypothetical protein
MIQRAWLSTAAQFMVAKKQREKKATHITADNRHKEKEEEARNKKPDSN